jgi:glutathionyl-hydroquinone reductase
MIVRSLKGLSDVLPVTVVHPTWKKTRPDQDEHAGWVFGDPKGLPFTNTLGNGGPFPPAYPDTEPDPISNAKSIREVYERAHDVNGKYTVPILWDKKLNTIVNNESSEIIRMLNSEFNEFAKNPDLDLVPSELLGAIDEVNDWVYRGINNGVYSCGFAKTQEAYDLAMTALTDAFDRVTGILEKQRYIAAGGRFTEADVRLFTTLLRWDEVYYVYFKINARSVARTPAVLNYCREIYQMPGVKETVHMDQIKVHCFTSHTLLNPFSIIPRGFQFEKLLGEPHNRASIVE